MKVMRRTQGVGAEGGGRAAGRENRGRAVGQRRGRAAGRI